MKRLMMAPAKVVPDRGLIATVIFTVPPQGTASVGQADSESLSLLKQAICRRLDRPVLFSAYPHRVGRRSCVAVHLAGARDRTLDILITVTGNTLWPGEAEFQNGLRWHICVPDVTDLFWVLKEIETITDSDEGS